MSGAWITNLFAKPLATLFGGGVTIIGLGIAFLTYRLAARKEPVLFPEVHRHQHPLVLLSGGRRMPAARVLVVLPHSAEQAAGLVRLAAEEAPGEHVNFLYIGHEDSTKGSIPKPFEILDPYALDKQGQQVFASAALGSARSRSMPATSTSRE